MLYKRLIAGLLMAFSIVSIYSFSVNDDVIARLQQQLEKWTDSHPTEKVYLHLDKPYYTAGDDIWFKAYVTIGTAHELSAYNEVLNVELINDQDSIKQSLKLQVTNGTAFGDFALPDTLHEGNYRIRAYTQYMLNAGTGYIFDQAISIGNVITNKVFTKTTYKYASQNGHNTINATINYSDINGIVYVGSNISYSVLLDKTTIVKGKGVTDSEGNVHLSFKADNAALLSSGRIVTGLTIAKDNIIYKSIPVRAMAGRADVQFFPESGNMINDIPTKVAFKVIGTDGLGVDIKGVVKDEKGNEVAALSPSHLGMGVFDFAPKTGSNYKAEVNYPDGSVGVIELPKASDGGYVMNLSTVDPQNIRLVVSAAKTSLNTDPDQQLSIVAQSAGKIYYAARSKAGKATFTTVIPANKFPSGIVQFTLFSATGEPLNERLVFIQNPDQANLTVSADKQSYTIRQKVKLNIDAKNKDGNGAIGGFSVAVTDESKVPVDENSENNILANMLLTSDIKGYVEQPAYYFNNVNEKTRADLDVLMLTQGYQRYKWKEILSNTTVADIYPRQAAFKISGKIVSPSGSPVAKGKVELINFDDGLFKLDTLTDENGRFAFDNLTFEDSVKFIIQARTAKRKRNVVIKLDSIASPSTSGYKNAADFKVNVGNSISGYAQNNKLYYSEQLKAGLGNRVISLKEIQISEKKNALKHSANMNGAGNADQVFVAKDMVNFNCVRFFDCFQGKLMGVNIRNGIPYSSRGGQMAVIIDGTYAESDDVSNININNVQSVEVLLSMSKATLYGPRGVNGAIIVTSKRGDDVSYDPQDYRSGVSGFYPKGFYKAREFYSPRYDAKTNNKLADLRTTIYWNPNLITDDKGKASVEFFNAGSRGTYRVVIEGINTDGGIARQVFRYKVE